MSFKSWIRHLTATHNIRNGRVKLLIGTVIIVAVVAVMYLVYAQKDSDCSKIEDDARHLIQKKQYGAIIKLLSPKKVLNTCAYGENPSKSDINNSKNNSIAYKKRALWFYYLLAYSAGDDKTARYYGNSAMRVMETLSRDDFVKDSRLGGYSSDLQYIHYYGAIMK